MLLHEAGVTPGVAIGKPKDSSVRLVVDSVSPTEVVAHDTAAKKRQKVTLTAQTVLDEYKVIDDEPTVVSGKDLQKVAPSLDEDAQWEFAANCLRVSLAMKDQELKENCMNVAVTTSPTNARCVVATKRFEKGAALFVPCSINISKAVEGKTYTDAAVHVKKIRSPTSSLTWNAVVVPKIVVKVKDDDAKQRCIPPCWFVQTTQHAELANAHLTHEDYDGGVRVSLPIMSAKKAIDAGAAIVCYRSKQA